MADYDEHGQPSNPVYHAAAWEKRFAELLAYQTQHGDCRVSIGYPENPALGKWLSQQRVLKNKGTLSVERIARLEALGVVWDQLDAAWDTQFAALEAFKVREGHCNVPSAYPENPSLGMWLSKQRTIKKKNKLSPERIARLEALGVVWDLLDAAWEERFAELVAYQTQHGNSLVSIGYPENPALGLWVSTQRTAKRVGTLSTERIARLDALAFVWDSHKAAWEKRFAELLAYQTQHGDCRLPQTYPENPALGKWLSQQRVLKNKGTLSVERIARLEALGVVWDQLDAAWDTQFAALEAFKVREGHCNVPSAYPENPSLGMWLSKQRTIKKKNKLSPERIARLEALGVVWDLLDAAWEERFAELVAYQTQHGHCRVPHSYPENPALGLWVSTQRVEKRAGTLSEERIARLDALEFVWELRTRTRS